LAKVNLLFFNVTTGNNSEEEVDKEEGQDIQNTQRAHGRYSQGLFSKVTSLLKAAYLFSIISRRNGTRLKIDSHSDNCLKESQMCFLRICFIAFFSSEHVSEIKATSNTLNLT